MIYSVFDTFMSLFSGAYIWSVSHIPDNILFVPLAFAVSFVFILIFLFFALAFSIIGVGIPLFIMYKIYKAIVSFFIFIAEETAYCRYTLKDNIKKLF